jgi:hypothetical protein
MDPQAKDASQNARKHGLTGEKLILTPAEQVKFDELSAFLRADLQPQDQFEESCFSRILHSSWRLQMSQQAENRAFADFLMDPGSEELQLRYERFAKYRRHYERSLSAALRDLRLSQENRFIRQNINLPPEAVLSPTLPVRAILRDFKKFQNELPQAISLGLVAETICKDNQLDRMRRDAAERRMIQNQRTAEACAGAVDPTRAHPHKTRAA